MVLIESVARFPRLHVQNMNTKARAALNALRFIENLSCRGKHENVNMNEFA